MSFPGLFGTNLSSFSWQTGFSVLEGNEFLFKEMALSCARGGSGRIPAWKGLPRSPHSWGYPRAREHLDVALSALAGDWGCSAILQLFSNLPDSDLIHLESDLPR